MQHRGGPPEFLKVLDDKTLGFADFRSDSQYISVGNVGANDRAALMLMDYPNRRRPKIYAHAELRDLKDDTNLARRSCSGLNYPPRFTEPELAQALEPAK